MTTQNLLNSLARQLRVIVLLTQMAQPNVLQLLSHILYQSLATSHVTQVSAAACNALLQILRIWSCLQHLQVVVSLYHQIVSATYHLLNLIGDVAHIGNHNKSNALNHKLVTYVLACIVRHRKRAHLKVAKLYLGTQFYLFLMVGRYLAGNAIVLVYTLVHLARGIYGQIHVMTQGSHTFYVVSVIVSNQDTLNGIQLNTILSAIFLKCSYSYSYIYYQPVCRSAQIIAITAATASKRYKSQHL